MTRRPHLLRDRAAAKAAVTPAELFLDLVFVFAVTQVSHLLAAHLDVSGALRSLVLLAALWWAWNYTAWVTNWLEPARRPVSAALLALTLAGLALAASVPEAFEARGAAFAGLLVVMQLGRTLFMLWAVQGAPRHVGDFQRIGCWTAASGALWFVGGFRSPEERIGWWGLALAVDLAAPLVGFRTPGLGRAATAEWDVDANHLAERCAGFVIIALGETLIVLGTAFSRAAWTSLGWSGLTATFLAIGALWWIYFDTAADDAAEAFGAAADRGAVARSAYTYVHGVLVAGIVVMAVGGGLVMETPDAIAGRGAAACIAGGPATFLAAHAALRRATGRTPPTVQLGAAAALATAVAIAPPIDRLALGAVVAAVLVAVAVVGMAPSPRSRLARFGGVSSS